MHYFKYEIDDLNQLFIPWKEPEFSEYLTKQEIQQTRLRHADTFYKYALVNFWNGVESDSLRMRDLVGASNKELPWDIEVDYDSIQKEVGLKVIKEDVENYTSLLKNNFIKMLEAKLVSATTNIGSSVLFKDYLKALKTAYLSLDQLAKSGLNPVQEIISRAHLKSYQDTYVYLNDHYADVWEKLLSKFDIKNKTIEKGELIDNIERYIKSDKLNQFYEFEANLVDIGYLNHSRNKWTAKENKSLITFFLYCRNRGVVRKPFDDGKKTELLKELQIRYNLDLKTMQKFSKWKNYSLNAVNSEYIMLEKIN